MLAKPVTCDPTKLGVLACITYFARGDRAVLGGFPDHHRNVVADDFRQASRVDRHHFRVVDREDVGQRLRHVGQAAEYRRAFGEGAGRGHRPVP